MPTILTLVACSGSNTICLFFLSLSFFPPAHVEGRLEVNMNEVSLEEVERSLVEGDPGMAPGGNWKPKDCLPRWKVSVYGVFTEGTV